LLALALAKRRPASRATPPPAARAATPQLQLQLPPPQPPAPVLQPQGLSGADLAYDAPVVAVGSVGDQFGDVLQHLLRLCRSADR
jgi:hypothetical protein